MLWDKIPASAVKPADDEDLPSSVPTLVSHDTLSVNPAVGNSADGSVPVMGVPDTQGSAADLLERLCPIPRPPKPIYRPAEDFAGISDLDELGYQLSVSEIDLSCPKIKDLIEKAQHTFHGAFMMARLRPIAAPPKPPRLPRKSPAKRPNKLKPLF